MNINEFIKSRRTIRKFKQTELTVEQLNQYVDAARVAPSAANLQPIKYIVVQSKEMVEKIFPQVKWAGYLAPEYNPKEGERPAAYVVVCADKDVRKTGYDLDIGAAIENMILSAWADGVGSCWMGSVNRAKVAEILDIPETMEISGVVALGYPKESPTEVEMTDGDVKYYLNDDKTLCVPKRDLNEVLIKTV